MKNQVVCTLEREDGSTVSFTCSKSQAKFLMSVYAALGFARAGWEVAI